MTRRTALALPVGMPIAEWSRLGRQIFIISDSSAWWLGDWLIYGQAQYPDRYKRAVAETSLDYQTLRNYAWVARQFSVPRRRDKLSFQHHAEVASLPEAEQESWLNKAERFKWSRNELRRRIKAGRTVGQSAVEVTHIQMSVIAPQKELWQEAAKTHEQDLLTWIISILDNAARSTLDVKDGYPQLNGGSAPGPVREIAQADSKH
ncbi:LmbU family transcriptional regulator [Sinosporangium siamense]|uniref:LmbU family transcriptional regulator n=1 Tax=Sinosporangium siamense TaxID=1367973 RepID=UPI0023B2F368|nr:LmbU family transcriptional regulator [Sinosporangium siamense]